MKWKKSWLTVSMVMTLSFALIGCSDGESFTPQEVVDNALQETKEVSAYFGEYTLDFGDEESSLSQSISDTES
ncbi:MAG: hypothetical protein RR651_11105, partial [Lysinibacillus sp.]